LYETFEWCNGYLVFDGSALSIPTALQAFKDESHWWVVAGAKGLNGLGLGSAT